MDRFSTQIRECMDALQHCHTMCLSTAMTHCLEAGGETSRPQHVRLMLDCAAICALTSDLLAHKSQFHNRLCGLCAEICEVCAEDCERLGNMQDCVQSCRRSAALCTAVSRPQHAEVLTIASRLPPTH